MSERPRKRLTNNAKATEKAPFERDIGEDALIWVHPEERDYYYNLDFLCGTYHGHEKRFKDQDGPCHALGHGEDE